MAKDLFSAQAAVYSKYRPTYPRELFDYILSFVKDKDVAWDCATGNGQAAQMLADYFKTVIATDISKEQIHNAAHKPNIKYRVLPAEKTSFPDDYFDLITIATAYHWLKWDQFHNEASRVGKENCVVAAWTYYTLITADDRLNNLYDHFYLHVTKGYWEEERKYVDEKYESAKFDFEPLPVKHFASKLQWTRDQFKGYLESWSSVQKYRKVHKTSPLLHIETELDKIWPAGEVKEVIFPISLRLGCIKKQ